MSIASHLEDVGYCRSNGVFIRQFCLPVVRPTRVKKVVLNDGYLRRDPQRIIRNMLETVGRICAQTTHYPLSIQYCEDETSKQTTFYLHY